MRSKLIALVVGLVAVCWIISRLGWGTVFWGALIIAGCLGFIALMALKGASNTETDSSNTEIDTSDTEIAGDSQDTGIASVVVHESEAFIFDEQGQQIGRIVSSPLGDLIGQTPTSVTFRHGNLFRTFDKRGRQISATERHV